MSSEGGPASTGPTDNNGKRKRPESPSQEPTSRKSKDIKIPQRQSARIELQKKQEKAHRLDLGHKFPKENSTQHLQVPVEPHGERGKSPWVTGPTSTNHPDNTLDDLGNFRMFVRDSRDEAELAVYVGLQNKRDLRHFALSWPVIKTWIKAPHKQTHSLKVEINHLIQDGKELQCIEDPYEIWPQRSRESEEHTSLRLTHIMAWHLVRMSKDIEEYIRSSDLDNLHRTRRYRGELSAMLELDIPLDNIFHPRPQLISWRNELNDTYDRCWSILGYISWIPYMKSWEKALGFFVSSENNAITYDSGMPTATRPRPNHLRLAQQCSSSSPGEVPKPFPQCRLR
ncbi:hypothetical protein N7516_007036 [Penicillium verrucosum]|uniref:uncharacterized protein n=1 Tax=Penicillium verrucosum TaxID=60171 RepID=UPI002545026D|nr:uncharacterized protein N7516_007036 [Penicillium verrucosum]KAJ5932547.1 hypothetical protein N7516_007036 [Penicillium verrucosum]